jgi:hypothetical protein
MTVGLLCKTHYISKFMALGGTYARYRPTPAFLRVFEEKRKTQKEIEDAHKLIIDKQLNEEKESRKKIAAEEKVVYAVNGVEFDINDILKTLPRQSMRGQSNGKESFLQSVESIYGTTPQVEEKVTYRTLRTVKEFDM